MTQATNGSMSDQDFLAKIEYEGGIFEALEYGLRASDLEDEFSPMARCWRQLERVWKDAQPLVDEMVAYGDEMDEGR